MEGVEDERWAMGSIMALAFNDPKKLGDLSRERREEKQNAAEERANVSQVTRLARLFARGGATVIFKG